MLRTAVSVSTFLVPIMQLIDTAQAAASASPADPTGLSEYFFTQGILGVLCVGLGFIAWKLWQKLEAERARCDSEREKHKLEIVAKDKLINELQEERLKEAREGYTFARSIQTTLDAFLVAMRQGSRA